MEQIAILSGFLTSPPKAKTQSTLDGFLASVEKQAFVIAMGSCQDQDVCLDIVQDAMYQMVKNYSKKSAEEWPALFFRILNNRITDQHRKRGFSRFTQWLGRYTQDTEGAVDAVDQLDSQNIEPDIFTDSEQMNEAIQTALNRLSFQQRQVLILRLWQGLSVRETASAMSISEGTVKTHLSRAVHEMRGLLTEFKPA